jgi:DNA-binding MarR family transcriptional regulator
MAVATGTGDRDNGDDPSRSWSVLVAVYQSVLHDVARALEQEGGLDSGVFSALAYLARAEPSGRMRLGELQELMHPRYSQPGLSRLVQRMEADGLVERRPHPDDGRASVVVLTRAGRRRFTRADEVYTAAVAEHFGGYLSNTQARALVVALEPVIRGRTIKEAVAHTVRPA